MRWVAALGVLLAIASCGGSTQVVPLLATSGVPVSQPVTVPLEIVTRSTAVPDPLPMRGSDVSYADVEAALGHAVATATVPWADRHREKAGAAGWQLSVELTSADADYDGARAVFTLGVRATLRARNGNVYLAQTQAACRQGGVVAPGQGASVMYRCMNEVGHQLASWLDGVDLDAVAPPRSG
jgi:hypothetical protein